MAVPIIVAGIRIAAAAIAKYGKTKAVAMAKAKKKKSKHSNQSKVEAKLRRENKGDAVTEGKIKRLREREATGLMSVGERKNALNKMTAYTKALKPGKMPGVGGKK